MLGISLTDMGAVDSKSTSTVKATWKKDCRKFCKAGVHFKVTEVSEGDKRFIEELARNQGVVVAFGDGVAYVSPNDERTSRGRLVTTSAPLGVPGFQISVAPDSDNQVGKTFLVVEDNSDDALLIRRAFNALESCRAVICRNLSEAKAYMLGAGLYQDRSKYPFPNAIICDLHLGFESGVEFLLWIKQQPDFKNMPVIILTWTATTSEVKEAKEKGALDVLRKPARYEDLRIMLNDLAAKLCS